MIEWYHIWLFTRIDSFKDYLNGVEVLFVIATVGTLIFTFINSVDPLDNKNCSAYKYVNGKFKWLIVFIAIIIPLINNLIPTQKEFAAIYLIPKVVNNESVQKIAVNVGTGTINLSQVFLNKTEQWLKEQIAPPKPVEKK